jgi:TIR domain
MAAGGHEVFTDRESIRPGEDWQAAIEQMIRNAEVVVVLWSPLSRESRFVTDEAMYARQNDKYLGFVLGEVDLPLGFKLIQHVFLNPDGSERQPGTILRSLEDFESRLSESKSSNRTARQSYKRERRSPPQQQSANLDIPPFLQQRAPSSAETAAPPSSGAAQPAPEPAVAPAAPAAPVGGVVAAPAETGERGYDVFISYSRKDEEACKLVFNLLVERGLVPWYDKDIGSGAFKTKIVTRISNAAVFVLLLSKNSVGSQNVSKELSVASSSDRLIIPISIDGISVADLNDTFRYELIELNIFNANPAVPGSWTDVVKTIADSVTEVREEAGAAVTVPLAAPAIAVMPQKARRPVLFAGFSFISALLQQAAVGYAAWSLGGADIPLAVAAAFMSGIAIYPLAYLAALLARMAFRPSVG